MQGGARDGNQLCEFDGIVYGAIDSDDARQPGLKQRLEKSVNKKVNEAR